jgi:hypothetical protein
MRQGVTCNAPTSSSGAASCHGRRPVAAALPPLNATSQRSPSLPLRRGRASCCRKMRTKAKSQLHVADTADDDEDGQDGNFAEPGGRSFLELSNSSDAALQTRMVQWYPGHIARAERQLKVYAPLRTTWTARSCARTSKLASGAWPTQAQLGMVDVVLEVRDARIPVSTAHPQVFCAPCVSTPFLCTHVLTLCRPVGSATGPGMVWHQAPPVAHEPL